MAKPRLVQVSNHVLNVSAIRFMDFLPNSVTIYFSETHEVGFEGEEAEELKRILATWIKCDDSNERSEDMRELFKRLPKEEGEDK